MIYIATGTGSGGAGNSTTKLAALFDFGAEDSLALEFQLSNPNSPATVQVLDLSSGANTINAAACPAIAKAAGVFIIPPTGNATAMTLKGISGDTGIAIGLKAPTFLSFTATPPSSFVITTGGAITGVRMLWV